MNIANSMEDPFLLTLHARNATRDYVGFFFPLQYLVLYQRGVNTSFQCCDQVLPLSQHLPLHLGAGGCSDSPNEASKKGISLPF